MAIDLLLILALILLNGFFAMSEMAVVTSRKSRLRQMAQTQLGARIAHDLAERPENFLSTVQIGITLVGILTGAIGGIAIADDVTRWVGRIPLLEQYASTIGLGLSVGAITFATLILGELVPKRMALRNPERVASLIAPVMKVLALVARPFVLVLALSTRLVLRLLGLRDGAAEPITEAEIRMIVAEGAEQGVIDAQERNMVNRVLRLGDRRLDSLMTPRKQIEWLDAEDGAGAAMTTIGSTPHSRYPVCRGGDGHVLGILEVKSLIGQADPGACLFAGLRPVLYLPESTPALDALAQLRQQDQSLALVVDEYGDIQGLVTANDVLEAAVGGSGSDRRPVPNLDAPVVRRDDGSWLVDGRVDTDDLRELLGVDVLPGEEEHDYHSAAGLLIAAFGRIPDVGESFQWRHWRFEVVDLDGARIDKLLISTGPASGGAHA